MRILSNGIGIEVDVQGRAEGIPLVLVMGLAMQLIGWPEELVALLVDRGFRVIRFDNRDSGLSDGFEDLGTPDIKAVVLRRLLRLPIAAPYSLSDMATDTVGILDALGIRSAHFCGASMGGMIVQHVAAHHADRVRTVTLMMSSSGARHLPGPSFRVLREMYFSRRAGNPREVIERRLRLKRLIGSPAYPTDPARARARLEASSSRAWRPGGAARQTTAILADGDRTPLLAAIRAPTQVIHGCADVLVPIEAGRDLAAHIPQARAEFIEGMGHDLPLQLLERFADLIAANARRTGDRPPH